MGAGRRVEASRDGIAGNIESNVYQHLCWPLYILEVFLVHLYFVSLGLGIISLWASLYSLDAFIVHAFFQPLRAHFLPPRRPLLQRGGLHGSRVLQQFRARVVYSMEVFIVYLCAG